MKNALVFQTNNQEDFSQNMTGGLLGKDYVPFSRLECVTYIPVEDDDTLSILERVFSICNDSEMEVNLNYSMSVGDVVVIDSRAYRCGAADWEELELTDKELKVVEEINEEIKNEIMEENEMNRVEVEAKSIVGVVGDGLKGASEAALGLCNDVAKEAKVISAMSQQEAENHISRKFHKSADKFIDWITDKLHIEVERSEVADEILGDGTDSETTSRLKRAINDFNKVKNAGDKKGWKKFRDLLKAVFGIVFAVFIEVAKVVLKLAFALAVGVVKIGACAIMTIASCASIVNDDVIKPTHGAIKKARTEHKARKAAKNVGVDEILDDDDCFEEE